MYGNPAEPRHLGGLVGAIDIAHFLPLTRFHARISELMERWCALPPAQPGGQVLYPGQPELMTRQLRLHEGIPVGVNLLREFEELARHYCVENTLAREFSPVLPPHLPDQQRVRIESA